MPNLNEQAATKSEIAATKSENTAPKVRIQHPKVRIQHPKVRIQHPKVRIQHPKERIQHPKVRIQHPKVRIQHPKVSIQHQSMLSYICLHHMLINHVSSTHDILLQFDKYQRSQHIHLFTGLKKLFPAICKISNIFTGVINMLI